MSSTVMAGTSICRTTRTRWTSLSVTSAKAMAGGIPAFRRSSGVKPIRCRDARCERGEIEWFEDTEDPMPVPDRRPDLVATVTKRPLCSLAPAR